MKYKVNVSAINQFSRCQYRWWAQYIRNRVPREDSEALEFGKLLHIMFEKHARGKTIVEAIEESKDEFRQIMTNEHSLLDHFIALKVMRQFTDLEEALVQWKDQYIFDIPVLETEEPFEIEHPYDSEIILVGRPDRVGVCNGYTWHVQNRGLHQGTNFGVYTDLAKRHYHEHVYGEYIAQKYPDTPYGGTFFNLVRKLKYRTGVTKKKPEGEVKDLAEMFYQFPMSINLKSDLHKHVMECVLTYAERMRYAEEAWQIWNEIPPPNEDMNGGYFRNKPDLYFRVLTGEISLDDDRYFKDRIDPYAGVEQDAN